MAAARASVTSRTLRARSGWWVWTAIFSRAWTSHQARDAASAETTASESANRAGQRLEQRPHATGRDPSPRAPPRDLLVSAAIRASGTPGGPPSGSVGGRPQRSETSPEDGQAERLLNLPGLDELRRGREVHQDGAKQGEERAGQGAGQQGQAPPSASPAPRPLRRAHQRVTVLERRLGVVQLQPGGVNPVQEPVVSGDRVADLGLGVRDVRSLPRAGRAARPRGIRQGERMVPRPPSGTSRRSPRPVQLLLQGCRGILPQISEFGRLVCRGPRGSARVQHRRMVVR